MIVTFVESLKFSDERETIFDGDEEFRILQLKLMDNPTCGDVIPGTNNVRKARFRSAKQSKGTSGGIRLLYRYVPAQSRIYLIKAYRKNEMENPSTAQLRALRKLSDDEVSVSEAKP